MRALFRLDGVRGLERALARGGEGLIRRVSAACEQTAINVRTSARRFAPRDQGDLVNAIQSAGKGLNWRVGIDDVRVTRRGGGSAHQHPSVYGVWYELGFVTRNIASHPFMKPAADGEASAHVQRTEAAINAAIGEMD